MARIDDYKESFRLASVELKKRDPASLAKAAGAVFAPEKGLIVSFLGTEYRVEIHPQTDIAKVNSAEEVSIPDKILIAHYLLGSTGKKPAGKLITFRQIPDGHFYFEAFQRRARDPFANYFGDNGRLFVKCAEMLGAVPVEIGDFGMEFPIFPHVRVQLVLWAGDEEFPADATILFDESIQRILSAEDIAVMSGSLVYRLIGLGRKIQAAA
ncbi:conserved hypothetical protein [Syntrophobacter sp. SbD2]|nr:conserved hypothetical protein [Syntrophobacter sp. SbD2]